MPVAKTAALLGTSALTDLPSMRTLRLVWVRVTAVARSKPQQDARLMMEGKAKALLEKVT